jgi:transposase
MQEGGAALDAIAVIRDGESVTEAAARYDVSRQSVHRSMARDEGGGLDARLVPTMALTVAGREARPSASDA